MADIEVREKDSAKKVKGAGLDSRIWMVVAFLAVGGLMAWLYYQTDRIDRTTTVVEAPVEEDTRAGEYEPGEITAVAVDAVPFEGSRLSFSNVAVAAMVGERAFWAEAPGVNPFLVAYGPDLTAPARVQQGDRFDIRGLIATVDDELLDEWVASGVISEGRRAEAEFATHYLLAERMVPAGQ
jgi:hypothetical protein